MKHVRNMDPVRRELMVILATMHNVEMEGMTDGAAVCRREIEVLRQRHPEQVDGFFRDLEARDRRRDPAARVAIEAMRDALKG
jgi:hypothetical protein